MAILLWQGPSMLDGAPIVLLATESSENSKTGNLLQTYIMRADMHPQEAIATGQDASVCGDCAYRGTLIDGKIKGRICYVEMVRGPAGVYRSFTEGRAIRVSLRKAGRGRVVRMGSYGDPAAVPIEIWLQLLEGSIGRTGYTHAWRYCDPRFQALLMASCDHPGDYREAQALGWKTYRVKLPEEARFKGERPCPASAEAGKHVTCLECQGCDGQANSYTINSHGLEWKQHAYRAFRLTLETS
ncbi:MAG: hypothetical protein ACK443_05760 [Methylococcaceae bacterium]